MEAAFADAEPSSLHATVLSFGFKYGIPVDADLVADVRFLPNPYWDPHLRDQTGLDRQVANAVLSQPAAGDFLDAYAHVLEIAREGYLTEGKRYVTVAIGCTGGKHRSVASAEALGQRLRSIGIPTTVLHRDLGRE